METRMAERHPSIKGKLLLVCQWLVKDVQVFCREVVSDVTFSAMDIGASIKHKVTRNKEWGLVVEKTYCHCPAGVHRRVEHGSPSKRILVRAAAKLESNAESLFQNLDPVMASILESTNHKMAGPKSYEVSYGTYAEVQVVHDQINKEHEAFLKTMKENSNIVKTKDGRIAIKVSNPKFRKNPGRSPMFSSMRICDNKKPN